MAETERGAERGGAGETHGEALEIRVTRWRRLSRWRKAVVWVMLASVFLLFLYPFSPGVRLRYLLTPYPRLGATHPGAEPRGGAPEVVDVRAEHLAEAEEEVARELEREAFPGAALAVGQHGRALLERGYGRAGWTRFALPVDPDGTLYDLSSLTKVLATTTAVMLLVEDGKMRLDDPVSRWLPAFRGEGRDSVTVRHLLAHTSGLPAGRELPGETPREKMNHLIRTVALIDKPGASVLYSDIGFIVLGEAAARAAGEPLEALLRRRVWTPLGMASTRFQPGLVCPACAPTLSLSDGTPFAGRTNDPVARELGGVTGNAGLFSTAHDVGRFAAMVARGGELDGVRVLRAETLRQFTTPQRGTRALGFEWFCREGTVPNHEECREPYAFGHTGYTGTSFWIEPRRGVWVVLLTNRTYIPRAPDRIRRTRRRVFNTVTGLTAATRADSTAAASDTAPN